MKVFLLIIGFLLLLSESNQRTLQCDLSPKTAIHQQHFFCGLNYKSKSSVYPKIPLSQRTYTNAFGVKQTDYVADASYMGILIDEIKQANKMYVRTSRLASKYKETFFAIGQNTKIEFVAPSSVCLYVKTDDSANAKSVCVQNPLNPTKPNQYLLMQGLYDETHMCIVINGYNRTVTEKCITYPKTSIDAWSRSSMSFSSSLMDFQIYAEATNMIPKPRPKIASKMGLAKTKAAAKKPISKKKEIGIRAIIPPYNDYCATADDCIPRVPGEWHDCFDNKCSCDGSTGPHCKSHFESAPCMFNSSCGDGICKLYDPLFPEWGGYCWCRDVAMGGSCENWYGGGDCVSGLQCGGYPCISYSLMGGTLDLNMCTCPIGITGPDCSITTCFSKSDADACNYPNGNCISVDSCYCQPGWTGPECQTPVVSEPTCFGKTGTNACNYPRGSCCDSNNCTCKPFTYYGAECELEYNLTCYGKNFTEACNYPIGLCMSRDFCRCRPGFTGPECGSLVLDRYCYGLTDTFACHYPNGTCNGFNNCTCKPGFTGAECETEVAEQLTFQCFGKYIYEACHYPNGICQPTGLCSCDSHYIGAECQTLKPILCYGENSDTACNAPYGSCIATDTCLCGFGYYGDKCQNKIVAPLPNITFDCHDVIPENSTCADGYAGTQCEFPVCSTKYGVEACNYPNGFCSAPENCTCNGLWYGSNCQYKETECFGKSGTLACNYPRGTCCAENNCTCKAFTYYGAECELEYNLTCYGKKFLEACNYPIGLCMSQDFCRCRPGFTGAQCESLVLDRYCYGLTDTFACHYPNGTCNGFNNCTCKPGFTGTECETEVAEQLTFQCYGKFIYEACHYPNGICKSTGLCECDSHYTGDQCETLKPILCYGQPAETACNAPYGSCLAEDTCLCGFGYGGDQCQYKIPLVLPNVTFECHDESVPNNTCQPGFTGTQCELPICNAKSGVQACNYPNGFCSAPDTCVCNGLWTGTDCEVAPTCFGKTAFAACSFPNGTCTGTDTCTCAPGFTGPECEQPICYGQSGTNACNNVLGYGRCVSPNTCVCSAGYTGTECQLPICYDKTGEQACNHPNGTCIMPNTCSCAAKFIGDQCELPVCYGLVGAYACNSPSGNCIAPDTCLCDSSHAGTQCELPVCYGKNGNAACNYPQGTCTAPNVCSCDPRYYGTECATEYPPLIMCYGKPVDTACNAPHGTCVANNTCVCQKDYSGPECMTYTPSVVTCYGRPRLFACNFPFGYCKSQDNCVCTPGWNGTECKQPVCYGKLDPEACNGDNGKCVFPQLCFCKPGYGGRECLSPKCYGKYGMDACHYPRGVCTAPNTCTCATGFTGKKCENPKMRPKCDRLHCHNHPFFHCESNYFWSTPLVEVAGDNQFALQLHQYTDHYKNSRERFYMETDHNKHIIEAFKAKNKFEIRAINMAYRFDDKLIYLQDPKGNLLFQLYFKLKTKGKTLLCADVLTALDKRPKTVCLDYVFEINPTSFIDDAIYVVYSNVELCLYIENKDVTEKVCAKYPPTHISNWKHGLLVIGDISDVQIYAENLDTVDPELLINHNHNLRQPVTTPAPLQQATQTTQAVQAVKKMPVKKMPAKKTEVKKAISTKKSSLMVPPLLGSCYKDSMCNQYDAGAHCVMTKCVCSPGYYGVHCRSIWYPNTCSSDNECYDGICENGYCLCDDEAAGSSCQYWWGGGECTNVQQIGECNNNGVCTTYALPTQTVVNGCLCYINYTGSHCEYPLCYGKKMKRACNYPHGTCVSKDVCQCVDGWTGAQCEIPTCYGLVGDEACNYPNGTCTGPNTCTCAGRRYGDQCEKQYAHFIEFVVIIPIVGLILIIIGLIIDCIGSRPRKIIST